MTREGGTAVVMVEDDDLLEAPRPLRHLAGKARRLDWTRGGFSPSDLARSIVGDVVGFDNPEPELYREVTLQLFRIPHEGGEITEDEVLDMIDPELLP